MKGDVKLEEMRKYSFTELCEIYSEVEKEKKKLEGFVYTYKKSFLN